MKRERHQSGWVQPVGIRTKKWRGHYYVYTAQNDGTEKRVHRTVDLGTRAKVKKWEAEQALQAIIDRETGTGAKLPIPESQTVSWFWQERYRPLKEPTWKVTSRKRTVQFYEHYLIAPFGAVALVQLNRFDLQRHLNDLAANDFSYSTVSKFRVYMKAMLDEAVEQDLIAKNPARRLSMPQTKAPNKRVLSREEVQGILGQLEARDNLIVRMLWVLALRPGELYALRRNDLIAPNVLRIDESVSPDRIFGAPKNRPSNACVFIPSALRMQLQFWVDSIDNTDPDALLFPTRHETSLNVSNFLFQVLKPAVQRARKEAIAKGTYTKGFLEGPGIDHRAFRRSCATELQKYGSLKDIQAHLRHGSIQTTADIYVQQVPASVRAAVEALDQLLVPAPTQKLEVC